MVARKVTEKNKNGRETYASKGAMARHERTEPRSTAKKEGDRPKPKKK